MKRLFYVVLIVLIVLVIGSFVRQNTEETVTPTTEVIDVVACDCEAKCTCPEGDESCDCMVQKSACDCASADKDAEEVVEENPEETSHEDETIVSE